MNPEGPQTPKIVDLAQVREKRARREQPFVLVDDEIIDTGNLPESPAEPLTPEEIALLFPPKTSDTD